MQVSTSAVVVAPFCTRKREPGLGGVLGYGAFEWGASGRWAIR